MQITFEVELDYGDDGPGEGEASPTPDDIATAVTQGLDGMGFTSVDVHVKQL